MKGGTELCINNKKGYKINTCHCKNTVKNRFVTGNRIMPQFHYFFISIMFVTHNYPPISDCTIMAASLRNG